MANKQSYPSENYVRLEGTECLPSLGSTHLHDADDKEVIKVMLVLRRRTDGEPLPDMDYYARTPFAARKKLSVKEFTAKYGAHPTEMKQIVAFMKEAGLTVVETSATYRKVVVSGPVSNIKKAFAVNIGYYQLNTKENSNVPAEKYRAYEGFIHIHKDLAPYILGVFGLSNKKVFKRKPRNIKPVDLTDIQDKPFYTPDLAVPDATSFYNFPNQSAAGQTIILIAGEIDEPYLYPDYPNQIQYIPTVGYNYEDITSYYQHLNHSNYNPPPQTSIKSILTSSYNAAIPYENLTPQQKSEMTTDSNTGVSYHTYNPEIEITQDICVASTVAQGADIVIYYCSLDTLGFTNALQEIMQNQGGKNASVISCSFAISLADDEQGLNSTSAYHHTPSTSEIQSLSTIFEDAALAAFTICVASGDNGAEASSAVLSDNPRDPNYNLDCFNAHVQYPASDPWVLCCGGTSFVTSPSGNSRYLEQVWNIGNNSQNPPNPIIGTTGGGVSALFPIPLYQTAYNNMVVPPSKNPGVSTVTNGRGLPDVAGNTFISYMQISNASSSHNFQNGVAGTSVVAPMYAGLIAIINSILGVPVGFINPFIYKFSNEICNDINPNIVGGPADNDHFDYDKVYEYLDIGYPAGKGWDACTGWGSIDGTKLLNKLLQNLALVPAGLPTTFATETDGVWQMVKYQNPNGLLLDLAFIKTSNTGTGMVEVHIASASSSYQQRILETGTTFGLENDGTWLLADYDMDGKPDLVFIKTANTPSGFVEVHIASGATKYKQRILEVVTPFPVGMNAQWSMYNTGSGTPNLYCIHTDSQTGKVVVTTCSGPRYNVIGPYSTTSTSIPTSSLPNYKWLLAHYDAIEGVNVPPDLIVIGNSLASTTNIDVLILEEIVFNYSEILRSPTVFFNNMMNEGTWQMTNTIKTIVLGNLYSEIPATLFFIKTKNTVSGRVELYASPAPFNKLA